MTQHRSSYSAPYVPPLTLLPLPRERNAPKKFKGKYYEVTPFIEHYSRLLDQFHVTSDADRCKGILQYCSEKVQDFIHASQYYQNPDWTLLEAEILKYYDADRNEQKYRLADLTNFLKSSHNSTISNLSHWKKYYREYCSIAGHLYANGHINDDDFNGYFWYGIPEYLIEILQVKLEARYSTHNSRDPWPIEYVVDIAEKYFQRDRFSEKLTHLPALGIIPKTGYGYDSDSESECHVPSRHVTPEPTTRLPVCISCPDTSGTHPATCGMSGPLRKNLCIHYASEHDPAAVGYRFLFGTTSDDTTCYIHAHSCLRYSTL